MPRAHTKAPRPPRPAPAPDVDDLPGLTDPDDEWGSTPEELGLAEPELGPPPPPPDMRGPVEKPAPPPASAVELGAPPSDTVQASHWAFQLQMRLAYDAMMDPNLTPAQRRKEVRVTLAGAAKHQMDALRYETLVAIQADKEEIERKRRGKASAKLEAAPAAPPGAKIIPMRRNDGG